MTMMPERRRMPRYAVSQPTAAADLGSVLDVQVREIGALGLLLRSQEPVHAGARALVRMTLSGVPLEAEIQVRRIAPSRAGQEGYDIGARFTAISPEHRQLIEKFVKR